jgi:hypothetical protein
MLQTKRFENKLCSRNTVHKRDIMVWVWNSAMYGDFRCESRVTECMARLAIEDKHKDMIIARN